MNLLLLSRLKQESISQLIDRIIELEKSRDALLPAWNKRFHWAYNQMKSWEGKCAILRHENNKLRKNMEMWRKKFEEGADKDFAATSYAYKAQNCTVCERIQLDGSSKWAIYDQHGNCIDKNKEAWIEPLPSNRDDAWLKLNRFDSLEEAKTFLRTWTPYETRRTN